MGPNFEVPTETKINHQLITNQTKIKLYPLDTCIHIPYQRISKENFAIGIETSMIKVTVVYKIMLSYSYPNCALQIQPAKFRCNSSCNFVTTESQRCLWLKKKLIFSLKGKSSKVLRYMVYSFYPYKFQLIRNLYCYFYVQNYVYPVLISLNLYRP